LNALATPQCTSRGRKHAIEPVLDPILQWESGAGNDPKEASTIRIRRLNFL